MAKIEKTSKNLGGEINEAFAKILMNQIKDLNHEFELIKTRISSNLKKLHIGILHPTIDKIINKILEEQLKLITENIQIKIKRFQTILKEN